MKNLLFGCLLLAGSALAQPPFFRFEPESPYPPGKFDFSDMLYKSPGNVTPEQQAVDKIGLFMDVKMEGYQFQVVVNQYLSGYDSLHLQKIKPLLLSEAHKHNAPADSILENSLKEVLHRDNSYNQPGDEPLPLQAFLLDFDHDGKVDVWVLQDIMFGPSLGHHIWVRQNDKPVKIIQGSGSFVGVQKLPGGKTWLTYSFLLIEKEECLITTHFVYDPFNHNTTVTKLYHASETTLPALKPPFSKFVVTAPLATLRTSPKVIEKSPEETQKPFRGNVAARFTEKAAGYVLAVQQDWAFVAFLPDTTHLTACYLQHGMDVITITEGDKVRYLPNAAYLCGWIYRKNIR